jgi:hypothetical protein
MRCLHRVPGEAMMSLMSSVLGMHGHSLGPRATEHVVAPKPSRTRRRVWSHRTCGDTGALSGGGPGALGHVMTPEPFPYGWRARCLGARDDTGALSLWVVCSVPRGTWRHQSPFLAGGALGASGHVATPEPFPSMWHALCHGAHGDTGALSW